MKVAGFTFIKNAVKFDFPIKEAILSILPICDEVVVAVGDCEDGTLGLIQSLGSDKIRIIRTVWNPELTTGGKVLADETNKALAAVSPDADWCFYIQGDEVFHEDGIEKVQQAMLQYKDDSTVDGLLVKYLHFYGSYDYIATSRHWYRNEIRIIKNSRSIYSYKDAQGFRKNNDEKLYVVPVDAFMYHYGWVKEPKIMHKKMQNADTIWHSAKDNEARQIPVVAEFDYSGIDMLATFVGKHPIVMKDRISSKNWHFEYDLSYNSMSLKEKIKDLVYRLTGRELFSYKNYRLK